MIYKNIFAPLIYLFVFSFAFTLAFRCYGKDEFPISNIYLDQIKPLLSPLENLLSGTDFLRESGSDNALILRERIVHITEEGTVYDVFHSVLLALTDGNIEAISDEIYPYRPEKEKIHLILAETIQPDGQRIPVREQGIIWQTPQRDADRSIYTGRRELRLIFPSVKKGSITRSIVVRESREHLISGHWTGQFSWGGYWPLSQLRLIVDLPKEWEKRLQTISRGPGVPSLLRAEAGENRVQLSWQAEEVPARRWKNLAAGFTQTGPILYLATLADWDEFARWYGTLVDESSAWDERMDQVEADWLEGVDESDSAAVTDLLYQTVARDIRYTSLDFGYSGLQPQPLHTVIENGYGDCKDKSNLLRILLRRQGIPAYLALINTRHAGAVEKRAPDFRHFNHAIVAIRQDDGSWLYADPTFKYGWPGLSAPFLADRPVLILDPDAGTSQWERTSSANQGSLHYQFPLVLSPSGDLTGWLDLTATGFYSAILQSNFETKERVRLHDEVEKYIQYFYRHAELIDFALSEIGERTFTLRAYFAVSGEGVDTLGWPDIGWLLPRVGNRGEVNYPAFLTNDEVRVELDVSLPEGYRPMRIPPSLTMATEEFQSQGNWGYNEEKSLLTAEFSSALSTPLLSPESFFLLFRAVESTQTWLGRKVVLDPVDSSPTSPTPSNRVRETTPLKGFQLMPTGEGQLALVDRLYPEDRFPVERRQALELTKEWHSRDPQTLFEAGMRLGWLDYYAGNYADSVQRAESMLRRYHGNIGHSERGWAKHLQALSHLRMGEKELAETLFRELYEDKQQTNFRRSWAGYRWAKIRTEDNPVLALELLLQSWKMNTDDRTYLWNALNKHVFTYGLHQELMALLEKERDEDPDFMTELLEQMAEIFLDFSESAGEGEMEFNLPMQAMQGFLLEMKHLIDGDGDPLETMGASLGHLAKNLGDFRQMQEQLATWQKENIEPKTNQSDWSGSLSDWSKAMGQIEQSGETGERLTMGLVRVLNFPVDIQFPHWLWRVGVFAHEHNKQTGDESSRALLEFIFELVRQNKSHQTGFLSLLFFEALLAEEENRMEDAWQHYSEILAMDLDEDYHYALFSYAGRSLSVLGEREKALEKFSQVLLNFYPETTNVEAVVRGAHLFLEGGQVDSAQAWIARVGDQWDLDLAETNLFTWELAHWLKLDRQGELQIYWTRSSEWWHLWTPLAEIWGVDPDGPASHPVDRAFRREAGMEENLDRWLENNDLLKIGHYMHDFAYYARWNGIPLEEFRYRLHLISQKSPQWREEIGPLVIALYEANFPYLISPTIQDFIDYANTFDQFEKYELGLDWVSYWLAQPILPEEIFLFFNRVGGFWSVRAGKDIDQWIEKLQKQYEHKPLSEKPHTANVLAQLYESASLWSKKEVLLETEVASLKTREHGARYNFPERLQRVRQMRRGSAQLSQFIAEWKQNTAPAWLRWIGPADLDPYQANWTDNFVKNPPEHLTGAEKVKFLALVAGHEDFPLGMRQDAAVEMFNRLSPLLADEEELVEQLKAFLTNDILPNIHRADIRWRALIEAGTTGRKDLFTYLFNHPQTTPTPSQKGPHVERLHTLAEIDLHNPEELKEFLESLLTVSPMRRLDINLFQHGLGNLMAIGHFETVDDLIKRFASVQLDPEIGHSNRVVQLHLRRFARRQTEKIRLFAHFQNEIRQWTKGDFPETARRSSRFPRFVSPEYLLETEQWKQDMYWNLANNQRSVPSVFFLSDLEEAFFSAHQDGFLSLLERGLPLVETDNSAEWLLISCFFLGLPWGQDDYRQMVEILRPLGDGYKFPKASRIFPLLEGYVDLMEEQKVDLIALGNNIQIASLPNIEIFFVIFGLNIQNRRDELRAFLENLSSSAFYDHTLIEELLKGWQKTGLTEDWEIGQEIGQELLPLLAARILLHRSTSSVSSFFNLLDLLVEKPDLDAKWIADAEAVLVGKAKAYFDGRLARYQGVGDKAEQIFQTLVSDFPRDEEVLYFYGDILYHNGYYTQAKVIWQEYLENWRLCSFRHQATRGLKRIEAK